MLIDSHKQEWSIATLKSKLRLRFKLKAGESIILCNWSLCSNRKHKCGEPEVTFWISLDNAWGWLLYSSFVLIKILRCTFLGLVLIWGSAHNALCCPNRSWCLCLSLGEYSRVEWPSPSMTEQSLKASCWLQLVFSPHWDTPENTGNNQFKISCTHLNNCHWHLSQLNYTQPLTLNSWVSIKLITSWSWTS